MSNKTPINQIQRTLKSTTDLRRYTNKRLKIDRYLTALIRL